MKYHRNDKLTQYDGDYFSHPSTYRPEHWGFRLFLTLDGERHQSEVFWISKLAAQSLDLNVSTVIEILEKAIKKQIERNILISGMTKELFSNGQMK